MYYFIDDSFVLTNVQSPKTEMLIVLYFCSPGSIVTNITRRPWGPYEDDESYEKVIL